MVDFICIVIPRVARSGSENSYLHWDSDSQSLNCEAATVTVRPLDLILYQQV